MLAAGKDIEVAIDPPGERGAGQRRLSERRARAESGGKVSAPRASVVVRVLVFGSVREIAGIDEVARGDGGAERATQLEHRGLAGHDPHGVPAQPQRLCLRVANLKNTDIGIVLCNLEFQPRLVRGPLRQLGRVLRRTALGVIGKLFAVLFDLSLDGVDLCLQVCEEFLFGVGGVEAGGKCRRRHCFDRHEAMPEADLVDVGEAHRPGRVIAGAHRVLEIDGAASSVMVEQHDVGEFVHHDQHGVEPFLAVGTIIRVPAAHPALHDLAVGREIVDVLDDLDRLRGIRQRRAGL